MRLRCRRVNTSVVGLGIAIATLGGCFSSCDTREERYPDMSAAVQSGAIAGGWIPAWTPSTARSINLICDLDTNDRLLTFSFESLETTEFTGACSLVLGKTAVLPQWTPAAWWPADHDTAPAAPVRTVSSNVAPLRWLRDSRGRRT